MFDFFLADANLPFSIAVLLLLLLATVEIAGLLLERDRQGRFIVLPLDV